MNRDNKLLIAGSDGYIGYNMVRYLSQDYELSTIGFYENKKESTFNGNLAYPAFVDTVVSKCPAPNVLIFLVGLAHKKGKGAELDLYESVNYKTLVNLLNGLEKENKLPGKIIFASTISVYGERHDISEYNENIQPEPFSPYALTKLKAEEHLFEKYPERSWILRFAPVYSQDFLLNIERRVKIGSYFYRVGNGESKLSLCNLKNIPNAIDSVINDKVPAGIYNLSDHRDYTYNDLIEFMGGSKVLRFPRFIIKIPYLFGKLTGNIFLKENSLKLLKDNTFPSTKIRQFVNIPYGLTDL